MSEIEQGHHQQGDPNGGNLHQGHGPYWTSSNRDWREWVGVVSMLVAMIIYLMTDALAWWPHIQPQPPPSGAVGR